jgi:hypothetical protein
LLVSDPVKVAIGTTTTTTTTITTTTTTMTTTTTKRDSADSLISIYLTTMEMATIFDPFIDLLQALSKS